MDNYICPVCGGDENEVIRSAFDDRYGHPGEFTLNRCSLCGHLMTFPRLQEADLPLLYGNYYPRKSIKAASVTRDANGAGSLWSTTVRWLSGTNNQGQYQVQEGDRVLDIGCGSGQSLLEARALGADAWGIEADPNVQSLAAELGLRIHQGSLNDHPFPGQFFDVVILNQVVEHLPMPDLTLLQIKKRLAPAGRVILVFPNISSIWCRLSGPKWINWHIPYHLHHFNIHSFLRMARKCGYKMQSHQVVTPNIWTFLQVRAWLVEVRRGERSSLWSGDNKTIQLKGGNRIKNVVARVFRSLLRTVGIAVLWIPLIILNRIIDTLGYGDSLVIVLVPED